jgi:hypothetical protein
MMIWVLNIDVAIDAIRTSFSPLSCSIEVYDYQREIRLRVFGPDNKRVLSLLNISMRDVVDPSTLRAQLEQARALVARKGFVLNPCVLPRPPMCLAHADETTSPPWPPRN